MNRKLDDYILRLPNFIPNEVCDKTLEEVKCFTNREIANYLKLPPIKLHCSMLAEDAVKKAIQNYKDNVFY